MYYGAYEFTVLVEKFILKKKYSEKSSTFDFWWNFVFSEISSLTGRKAGQEMCEVTLTFHIALKVSRVWGLKRKDKKEAKIIQ